MKIIDEIKNITVTVDELTQVSDLMEELPEEDRSDFTAQLFMCARVAEHDFKLAGAIHFRMTALVLLIREGSLPGLTMPLWDGSEMIPGEVWDAAATTPLVEVGNQLGFNIHDFRREIARHASEESEGEE